MTASLPDEPHVPGLRHGGGDSSLKQDRGVKSATYARAGVPEYWVVNLQDRVVEVHLDPEGTRYVRTSIARRGESITLASFPDVRIDLDRFLR